MEKKQNSNYLIIGGVVLLLSFFFLGVIYYNLRRPPKTTLPVPITSTPTAENILPLEREIELRVAGIGGGIEIEEYDFTFSFTQEENEEVIIVKREENEYKNFENFPQGAIDKGFIIKKNNLRLEVYPIFESAGLSLENELSPVIISNPKITDMSIFRLRIADIYKSSDSSDGWMYTTQYREGTENCSAWESIKGEFSSPACIWGGPYVETRDGTTLSITCFADEKEVDWCDNIVRSIKLAVEKR